jgi:hypothetical protein
LIEQPAPFQLVLHPLDPVQLARKIAAVLGLPLSGTEGNPTERQQRMLELVVKIWSEQRDHILGEVEALQDLIAVLMERGAPDALRRQGEMMAHTLLGTLGTFGFSNASQLAGEVEKLFAGESRITEEDALGVAAMVAVLRQELERVPAGAGVDRTITFGADSAGNSASDQGQITNRT